MTVITLNPKTPEEVRRLRNVYSKSKVVYLSHWKGLIETEKRLILDKNQDKKNIRRKEP